MLYDLIRVDFIKPVPLQSFSYTCGMVEVGRLPNGGSGVVVMLQRDTATGDVLFTLKGCNDLYLVPGANVALCRAAQDIYARFDAPKPAAPAPEPRKGKR